jgi:hypothetical protein
MAAERSESFRRESARASRDPTIVQPVTGWQSGGGDQGGWNQNQSFGPDAQTNSYGADPYYGGDPGYDPYQQYPPTGGFPVPGYGAPPPPEKRSKLPMILSLVAIVIIVGAVVAIVIVNRKDSGQPVAQDPSTSSSKTSSSSSSDTPTSTSGGGEKGDWIAIDNTSESGLSYQVPPDWKTSSETVKSGNGVDFTGAADYGVYDCEGSSYVRTFAASGDVQGSDGKDLDLATTLEDFAKSFGSTYYGGETAQVDVGTPKETKVDGKTAMTVTAKVTQQVSKPNCQATEGEVVLVGVLLETEGQPKGVAMLVVVNDLTGGPSDPKPLDASVSQEILGTVKAG